MSLFRVLLLSHLSRLRPYICSVPVFLQISTVAESEDSQESVDSVTDSQKRREILSRRPSYRRVPHPRKEYRRICQ